MLSFNRNKKITKNRALLKTAIFGTAVLTSTIFTSCFSPVFSSIRKEVQLEEADISGFINSIVRFTDKDSGKEYLYLQNGRIFYKEVSDDEGGLTKNSSNKKWTHDTSAPGSLTYDYDSSEYSGVYFYKLASDENYIYALAYTPIYNETYSRNVPTDIKLYCASKVESGWTEVKAINKAIADYISRLKETNFMLDSSIQLFCTNSPKSENRAAFIRIGGGSPYYDKAINYEKNYGNISEGNYGIIKLNGENTTATKEDIIPLGYNGASQLTISAVAIDDGDGDVSNNFHFFKTASVTNESRLSDATYVYFANLSDGTYLNSFSTEDFRTLNAEKIKVLYKTTETVEEDGSEKVKEVEKETDFYINRFDAVVNGLYKYKDGTTDKESVSIDDELIFTTKGAAKKIISLCATKDSVLMGTNEQGVFRVCTTDGKPDKETKSFDNNADTIMTTPYIIRVIFCTDPSIGETENGSALYSSMEFHYTQGTASADYDNVGLWSYYSDRDNWNRE